MMTLFAHGDAATHAAEKVGLPWLPIIISLAVALAALLVISAILSRPKSQPTKEEEDS